MACASRRGYEAPEKQVAVGTRAHDVPRGCSNRSAHGSGCAVGLWSDDELDGFSPGEARAQAWVALRERELRSLSGQHVLEWRGLRLALREVGPDGGPQFDDPEVPFLQFASLYLLVASVGWIQVINYQSDNDFGLFARRLAEAPSLSEDGTYRPDDSAFAPLGMIGRVSTTRSACGSINSVELLIDGALITIVAAEAEEQCDGSLAMVLGDESIFLFTDQKALRSMRWRNIT